jgi:DNA polymerase-1
MVCLINADAYTVQGTTSATIEECVNYLTSKKVIAVDTETTGLDPYLNKVIMLQVGDEQKQFIIDVRQVDPSPLKKILEDPQICKVLVNAKFDYKMLVTNFNIRLANVRDCMLQEQVLLGAKRGSYYSLEKLAKKYLNYSFAQEPFVGKQISFEEEAPSKSVRLEFLTLGDKPFTKPQIDYGVLDVLLPLRINRCQEKVLELEGCSVAAELENEFVLCLGDIELNGFFVDTFKWLKTYEQNLRRFNWTRYLLKEWLVTNNLSEYLDINWNSPKQVISLFKKIGIPTKIIDRKKSRGKEDPIYKDSIQKLHIKRWSEQYPIIPLYLKYKELQKATTSYGSKFLEHVHPTTGRIHSSYRQILNTGRVSSSSPNLQNITRGSEYRSCFTASTENKTLVVCDYSGQESRIMADISGDKNMINFFLNGDGDLHSYTARQMWPNKFISKSETPELRYRAKILNFSIPYGISDYKLSKDFEIPRNAAKEFISDWFRTYPGISIHFEKSKKIARDKGYVLIDRVTGRRYYPPQHERYVYSKKFIDRWLACNWKVPKIFWSDYFSALGSMDRAAQNYQIQGLGASMTKLATIYLRQWIKENNYWKHVHIVNVIHDEIVVECSRNLASEVSIKLKQCMESAGEKFCPKVPMIAQPVITNFWNH